MLNVKKTLAKLMENELQAELVTKNVTLPANGQSAIDIALSLPQNATILAACLVIQPNANWIYCGIHAYNNTTVKVGYHNTSNYAITGDFSVAVFYKI